MPGWLLKKALCGETIAAKKQGGVTVVKVNNMHFLEFLLILLFTSPYARLALSKL
jgi:hypothetical protein